MNKGAYHFSDRTNRMGASIIREILKISSRPGMISFAGGLPAPETFPLKEFEISLQSALQKSGAKALQYTTTEGLPDLKKHLCDWLRKQDIDSKPEDMLLTHGSQQALDLIAKIFLNPGDSILVEDPTYLGAIQSFNAYQPKYVTVPIDDQGFDPEKLKQALSKHKIKFIYTVPTFQNPSGLSMSVERRKLLLSLAHKKNIPIIEDDPYSRLRFKGEHLPSLYSLANGKGVVFMSTFSKLLSPGIRLGFLVAGKEIIRQLIFAKQASDLQTNTLVQYGVNEYFSRGYFEKHIPAITKDYGQRAQVMYEAMKKYFPAGVQFNEPEGGMFIWCTLPPKVKASEVFKKSIKEKVAFVDGSVFYANGGGENTMRLNFTNSNDETIRTGIARLGKVLQSFL